jgi:uncharacterized protein
MTEFFPGSRRALVYLALAFAITWVAWGSLVALVNAGDASYGQVPYMALYVLGGLGPTIAAYLAVWFTRTQAPVAEFNRRVLRWRVRPGWYVVALGLPALLGFVGIGVAVALRPALADSLRIAPWYRFFELLPMMVVGGGLEEFGWRGVMQEEWGRTMGAGRAALLIGPVWALWHLPLFSLPGVTQFHAHFALFLLGIMGNALLLGWLYSRTDSILLCVLMHAAANTIVSMGIVVPSGHGLSLAGPCLNLGIGALLFLSTGKRFGHADPHA